MINRNNRRDRDRDSRWVLILFIFMVFLWLLTATVIHQVFSQTPNDRVVVSLYIKHKNPRLPRAIREEISEEIIMQCRYAGIPWEVVTAIMCVESRFNPGAVGPLGERGLMQIYTMECNGWKIDATRLFDIPYNITWGVCLFKEKLGYAKGDLLKAIQLYNGTGIGARRFAVKVQKALKELSRFRVGDSEELSKLARE